MKRRLIGSTIVAAASMLFTNVASAQFNTTGSTSVGVTVGAEAAISVTTGTTTLATTGTTFNPFTGTTSYSVKIRTTETSGTGTVTLKVTTDFGAGGPSVATPPTAGDTLSYSCAVITSGTPCTGSVNASNSASTSVATFGAGAHSTAAGNTSSVSWALSNDPLYKTGTYTATVTFTVAQT
jgi:hypothetical protein